MKKKKAKGTHCRKYANVLVLQKGITLLEIHTDKKPRSNWLIKIPS